MEMAHIEERKADDGQTKFRVQIRLRGFPQQTATFDRKTDAKRWAQKTEAAMKEGRYFKTTEAKKRTLGDLIDRYIKEILPRKPKNAHNVEAQLRWWKQVIGHCVLVDVTPAIIGEHRDRLLAGKTPKGNIRSPSTVVRYLSALSHTFTVAIKEWGWLEDNPLLKVCKPQQPRGRVRFLDNDERERLLEACKTSTNPYIYIVVVLGIATGMRQGEMMNLRWSDVDFGRKKITLYETKNGEMRVLPLVGHAHEVLKELMSKRSSESELVFPSNNPKKPIDLRHPWEQVLKKSNIVDFRFHDLRHCCASYLLRNNVPLPVIAEILGHKSYQMVKRYAHLSEDHKWQAIASMNQNIFGC
jgi:integrase